MAGGESKGFTLVEILVALSLGCIVLGLSVPYFQQFKLNLQYRGVAREVASLLRAARTRAIATNLEHRVEFDVDGRRYRMTCGNKSADSDDWSLAVADWSSLPAGVFMRTGENCTGSNDLTIEFNPSGTGNARYVCVMDSSYVKRHRVAVVSSTTGRVRVVE